MLNENIDRGFALQRKFQRQCVWIEGRHAPSTHIFLATHSTSVADSVRSPAAAPSTNQMLKPFVIALIVAAADSSLFCARFA